MATILDHIAAYKREEIARAKVEIPERELDVMALDAPPIRSFTGGLSANLAPTFSTLNPGARVVVAVVSVILVVLALMVLFRSRKK